MSSSSSPTDNNNKYVRQSDNNNEGSLLPNSKKQQPLYPKVGDIVRYYDLDGGRPEGEVLVGRISFIQKQLLPKKKQQLNTMDNKDNVEWLVELTQLEDVGDGYYANYNSMRQRNSKRALRRLQDVAPIAASFVKSENAYKIPRQHPQGSNAAAHAAAAFLPMVRAEQYDIQGYTGPFGGVNEQMNPDVVAQDGILYSQLKGQLLRNAAIVGVIGTLMADLAKGTEDAIIYAVGVVASIIYLFLLSIKTDTLASPNAKFGSNIANVRFLMPLLVVASIALYNQSLGEQNPLAHATNPLDRITPEQFAAAMFGFLTYRIPLFVNQIQAGLREQQPPLEEGGNDGNASISLPGSAGIVLQQLTQQQQSQVKTNEAIKGANSLDAAVVEQSFLTPVLVISGPQATGRTALVKRLVEESGGRYVLPTWVDRYQDGASFERMERRGEFLQIDPTGRFGLSKQSVLTAAAAQQQQQPQQQSQQQQEEEKSDSDDTSSSAAVVVVDANVDLARKLMTLSGARLIGVWIGLRSVDDFKTRLEAMVDRGEIAIPQDETKESVIRARIREIVKEIEFGVVSGLFEFTILNDDDEQSFQQLKEAAAYAFR
jgi:guanylate kinase